MDLHELLRDLVARQGSGVVDNAEAFRAALDDFLTEEEATTGELNLLVDAVRLGAVGRLLSLLDHGGEPHAAVAEAGDLFARDRGTDDTPRCRWAVAAIGYALGRLSADAVPADGGVGRASAPPAPAPPEAPAPPAVSPPAPTARPAAPPTEAPPRTFPSTEDTAPPVPVSPPVPPVAAPPPRRRGRVVLAVLLVAAVVAAAVLVGMQLGADDDPTASDDETGGPSSQSVSTDDSGGPTERVLPESVVVLPVTDEDDLTRIYSVDVESGETEALTDGPDDRVPVISPDRRTLIYSDMPRGAPGRPMVMDLASGETRRLFVTPGGCEYSARPAFNPAGNRLAVVCLDEAGDYVAMYVVNLRGGFESNVPFNGTPIGSPTWVSPTTLVWAEEGETEDVPTTLWRGEVGGAAPEQLTDGSAGFDTHPDWSEEAGLLVWSRHEDSRPFGDLLTADIDQNLGPATDGALWGHPAWSPDGTRVVFTIEEGETEVLHVATLEEDGFSEPTPVEGDLPGEPGVPAWGTR